MRLQGLQSQKPDKFYLSRRAFSLIEVTLALSIFVMGFMALFNIVNSYSYTLKTIKERMTANFLAQEGLELVLAKRNANFKFLNSGGTVNWIDGLGEKICINPDLSLIDSPCSDGKLYLDSDTDVFSHNQTPTSKQSAFSRIITIAKIDTKDLNNTISNDYAVLVESEVKWSGEPIILKMVMTKWHPKSQ
ncbi:MAG: hypothetical protein AAB371_00895 [Patescibacteria group bacterium]